MESKIKVYELCVCVWDNKLSFFPLQLILNLTIESKYFPCNRFKILLSMELIYKHTPHIYVYMFHVHSMKQQHLIGWMNICWINIIITNVFSSKTIPYVHSRIKPPPMLYDRHCVCIRSKYIYVVNFLLFYCFYFHPPFPQCYLMENIFNIFMQNIFILLKNDTNISGWLLLCCFINSCANIKLCFKCVGA